MPFVQLTRESVAAGDDAHAPHAMRVTVPAGATPHEVLEEINRLRYLPRVAGGKATWVAGDPAPLAVLAQQWPEAIILPAGAASAGLPLALHFRYLGQDDPAKVVAALSAREQQPAARVP